MANFRKGFCIMTRVNIIGIRHCDFSDSNGNPVKGDKVYASFQEDNVEGEVTDSFWLSSAFPWPQLHPGMVADFDFNHKGRLVSVKVVKDGKF